MKEVERDRRAAPLPSARTVDDCPARPVGVLQRTQHVEQPRAERGDAGVDRLNADALEEVQADLDRRQVQVVDRAVLEMGCAWRRLEPLTLHERGDDRPAREPRPLELRQCVSPREQAADARWPAEHLVERNRHEVRMPATEVKPVRRYVRGGVQQHIPAVRLRLPDPFERVLDAGEVRLRGVREQVVVIADRVGQIAREQPFVDPQLGGDARNVGGLSAVGTRELTDAIDRVVVVEREQETVAVMEGVPLADLPQRPGCVGREDRHVLLGGRSEELEHVCAGALDQFRARCRGRVR